MTVVVNRSKPGLEEHKVLQAIRSAKCEIDHRVRNGVYGESPKQAINKLAQRMGVGIKKIQGLVRRLMDGGLVRYAGNRLFVCRKAVRDDVHRRSVIIKGKRKERLTARPAGVPLLEIAANEACSCHRVPREWWDFDPKKPDMVITSDPIPPAGGWADDVAELKRLTDEQFVDWATSGQPRTACYGLEADLADRVGASQCPIKIA